MKIRQIASAVMVGALMASGPVMAQSTMGGKPVTTSPSNTPNDGTAVPPNQAVPAGQQSPAPTGKGNDVSTKKGTQTQSGMTHKKGDMTHKSSTKTNAAEPGQPMPKTGGGN
ncbi:MAG: hypothetical protein ABW210_12100 [Achromobacter sp.]|jgi:hypothetical protein